MQANSWHHKLFQFECRKKGENVKKTEYIENKKSFLDEI